jgi:hypothetical protein
MYFGPKIMNQNQKYLASSFAVASGTLGLMLVVELPVSAEPSPEVQSVVDNAIDTIPLLTSVCLVVFGAGLAPWAARTTLSWLSSIMKGAI